MQTIIVDMTPGFRMPTIYYSQGDVGTQFAIDLRSRFGDSFPTGTTVTIQATKPSGFGFSVAATSVTNGVATFTTTAEMTDEFGRFPAELKVTKTGLTLFTANFYMDGERNTHPEGTTDGSQETVIPELAQLVERVEDAASSVLDMTVVANTLPAGSDATYSYDEETNTATFGIPKGADGSLASGVLAPTYSSSSTYAVGDYVYYSGSLYRCTTAITTAEAWTSGHWTQVALAPEVSDLKSDLGNTPIILEAKLNELVPCYLGGGKKFTIQTADGSNFVVNNLMLYDENKVYTNGDFYALKAQNTNSRTITIPSNKTFYYVALDGGTAQKCKIINMPQNIGGQVASVTNEIVNINHAVADNLSTTCKIAILHTADTLVPVGIKAGDSFVIKTLYGNKFSGGNVNLFDSNKHYIGYYGITSNYGAFRSFVSSVDIGYVSVTVAQDIAVINTTDISQEVNNSINTDVFKSSADVDRKSVQKNSDFDFIFFSDIHNSESNGVRIFDYAEKIGAGCIINGGDTVGTVISDDIAWYNTAMANSSIDTLTCIGNHDAWTSQSPQVVADQTDIYAKFITPMVSNVSNIIQPTGAETSGYCYYYKDYDDIRVIVLQAMPNLGWTTAQNTWFASVLADAITNSKSVICVNHAPYYAEYADIDTDCPLNSYYGFSGFDAIKMPQDAVASVDTFINNGGEFICWLTGHTHGDYVMHNTVYPNQFLINIATARFSRHFDGYAPTATETWSDNYDCFDYIGVDTTNKMLKVLRVGYHEDASMRIRNRFAYDYGHNKLLSNS